eukprot:scaffold8438_cov91-Skeletonema_marinoi.AAC.1
MPSAFPSVEPTGSPTSTFWALQKEAIRKGSYDADTGPNYDLIRYIVLGVVGFAAIVAFSIFSHMTYKRCKSGSHRRERSSSRGRSRRHRLSGGRISRYDDYVAPDYSNSFSEESQSDQGDGLEAGIASPKSIKRDNIRDHQPLAADLSACTSEFDDVESYVVDEITKAVTSFIDKPTMRVRREVFAPAGKLGIIVDTSNDGPIVHSINGDSPLVGQVFAGDYIVAVDGEDTSDWSAHNVTKLVARKSGSARKLTLMSKNWDDLA